MFISFCCNLSEFICSFLLSLIEKLINGFLSKLLANLLLVLVHVCSLENVESRLKYVFIMLIWGVVMLFTILQVLSTRYLCTFTIFSATVPGLPQGSNPTQSSAIPLMSQQQARQPNSTSVQSSLTNLGQNLPGVNQTSTLQNMSGMPQNTMNNGLAQGASQDIYATQRQMAGRQQQQQQSQNQLIYQQQQIMMKQKLQQIHLCNSNLCCSQHRCNPHNSQ